MNFLEGQTSLVSPATFGRVTRTSGPTEYRYTGYMGAEGAFLPGAPTPFGSLQNKHFRGMVVAFVGHITVVDTSVPAVTSEAVQFVLRTQDGSVRNNLNDKFVNMVGSYWGDWRLDQYSWTLIQHADGKGITISFTVGGYGDPADGTAFNVKFN